MTENIPTTEEPDVGLTQLLDGHTQAPSSARSAGGTGGPGGSGGGVGSGPVDEAAVAVGDLGVLADALQAGWREWLILSDPSSAPTTRLTVGEFVARRLRDHGLVAAAGVQGSGEPVAWALLHNDGGYVEASLLEDQVREDAAVIGGTVVPLFAAPPAGVVQTAPTVDEDAVIEVGTGWTVEYGIQNHEQGAMLANRTFDTRQDAVEFSRRSGNWTAVGRHVEPWTPLTDFAEGAVGAVSAPATPTEQDETKCSGCGRTEDGCDHDACGGCDCRTSGARDGAAPKPGHEWCLPYYEVHHCCVAYRQDGARSGCCWPGHIEAAHAGAQDELARLREENVQLRAELSDPGHGFIGHTPSEGCTGCANAPATPEADTEEQA